MKALRQSSGSWTGRYRAQRSDILVSLCGWYFHELPALHCAHDHMATQAPNRNSSTSVKGTLEVRFRGPGGTWVSVVLAEAAPSDAAAKRRDQCDKRHFREGDGEHVKRGPGEFEKDTGHVYGNGASDCLAPVKLEWPCRRVVHPFSDTREAGLLPAPDTGCVSRSMELRDGEMWGVTSLCVCVKLCLLC